MGEDGLRNRKDNGPDSPTTMRRLASDPVRTADCGKVTSVRGKLKRAGWDDGFLLKVAGSAAVLEGNAEPEETQMR